MEPVSSAALGAAILEGVRRARSANEPLASGKPDGEVTLTEIVERAAEHAEGVAGYRLAGTGERLDRTA